MKHIIWLIPLSMLLACPDRHHTGMYMDNVSGIDSVYANFSKAYAEKNPDLITSIYQPDAYYLNPGDSIKQGHSAFIPGFAGMFSRAQADTVDLHIQFDIVSRDIEGNMATDIGYYHLVRQKNEHVIHTSTGKFITVLRKQADGSWRFTADGYSEVEGMKD